MKTNLQMQFINFYPHQSHRDLVARFIDRLQDTAPYNASIKGTIEFSHQEFEGKVRVASRAGIFIARARAGDLMTLTTKLQSKITRQVIRWKETRFSKRDRRRHREMIHTFYGDDLVAS